ncbi:MAG: hypothetical protein ACRCVA_15700 [Phreatobacter sp.]
MPLAPRYRRVAVYAPSASTTGGPELLHQLVHEIRVNGGEAAIHYVPDPLAAVPERYRIYDIPTLTAVDPADGDCIVVPETMVRQLPLWSPAERYIWWLSFDFFQSRHRGKAERILANLYKETLIRCLTRLGTKHLFQSHYARSRLRNRGMSGELLSDYLSIAPSLDGAEPRQGLILYNPKKGMEITGRLQRQWPDLTFLPIVDMTRQQVEDAFRRAKIYIDFGEHPGKDRLPREAALMGTVVVVGVRGAAAFDEDVTLPRAYKLDIDAQLPARFRGLVDDILSNFGAHQDAQRPYREIIAAERAVFAQQVRDVFFVSR